VKLTFVLLGNAERPTSIEAVSGHPMLKGAAIANLKTWKFENPYAVERKYETTFKYRLSGIETPGPGRSATTFESFREVDVFADAVEPLNTQSD
jgi:hypothetical protein